MKFKKESIGNLIRAIIFLIIIFMLFLFFTYLFRTTETTERKNILGYYEEKENSLDVVFVGASNVNRYWDPLRAWNEYGFTSRNHVTTGMHASTYLAAIQDALRTQNPKVVVVEARMFTKSYDQQEVTPGARKLLDSLDYDLFRLKSVYYYCKTLNISWEDSIPLYIDLIQYHDNYSALTDPEHWTLADNRLGEITDYSGVYKGYYIVGLHNVYADPSGNLTEESTELEETALNLYTDIIEYCQNHEIPLVIMASPMVATKNEVKKLNSLAQVAQSYGVDFVDANRLYEEIGIDFAQDFYDNHHVNVLGSSKFTDYFAAYLDAKFDLPDHRNDTEYASWNELYEGYIVNKGQANAKVLDSITAYENALQVEAFMTETDDPMEWLSLGDNSEITLLAVANESFGNEISIESKLALKAIGATDEFLAGSGSLKVVYNNATSYNNSSDGKKTGKIGSDDVEYTLATGKNPRILIGKNDYYDSSRGGMQISAFDINTNEVFDTVYLTVAEDGSLQLRR